MTDTQVLTLAFSIIIPLAALIFSNSRVNDAKEILRAEMALGFERVLNEIKKVTALLKIHELDHHHQ